MSKSLLALGGLVLAASGFLLGHYSASLRAAAGPDGNAASGDSIADVLADPEPFRRAQRLAALLPTLGPEAVPEVRKSFESSPGFHEGPAALELLVRFWASHEPEAAALWAFSSAPPGCSIAAIEPAVERWASVDPKAAAQYIRTPGVYRASIEIAEVALVRGWFQSGVPGLEDYIRDLGLSLERQRALAALARETIRRDGIEAGGRWVEGLPDEDEVFKTEAFTQFAAELAKTDPTAAVAWCEVHCSGPYGASVRTQIATHWAARDGLATMRWLSTSPAGKDRDAAVETAFFAWRHNDAQGLSDWLEGMDAEKIEPWFRPAAARYALMLSRTDPAAALEWADRVEDEQERELALITIARRWRKQDQAAAEAWLEKSTLSEEARERARNETPRTTPEPRSGAKAPRAKVPRAARP